MNIYSTTTRFLINRGVYTSALVHDDSSIIENIYIATVSARGMYLIWT